MRRELREDEIDFIEEFILERDSASQKREEIKEATEQKRKNFTKGKLKYLIAFIMSLPVLGTLAFYAIILRMQSAVGGSENLKWIAQQKVDGEFEPILRQYNLDWLPTFIQVYNNRFIIIGLMFTAAIVLSMIIMTIAVLRTNGGGNESDSEEINNGD